MVPKHVYETLDPEEQSLWHSHEFEVASGMLVLPKPGFSGHDEWHAAETEAMKQVAGLYGKTWHTWQVDRGDEIPLGSPKLMGSLTREDQIDLDSALEHRNKEHDVDHKHKAKIREQAGVKGPGVHENADSWWKEHYASQTKG